MAPRNNNSIIKLSVTNANNNNIINRKTVSSAVSPAGNINKSTDNASKSSNKARPLPPVKTTMRAWPPLPKAK
jgi:hypothetical protein